MEKFKLLIVLGGSFLLLNLFASQVYSAPVCDARCQKEDPCCAKMVQNEDYHECEWPDPRGYCRPETCNKLAPGLENRGHCGWYWTFHEAVNGLGTNTPDGYGCMIGASEATMKPICDGGTGGGPAPTSPPGGGGGGGGGSTAGSGSVKINVHKNTVAGALFDSGSVSVYIEGPTSTGHRFGETLVIPGTDASNCTSKGGFPFSCSTGTATWQGADGRSGTSAGSYSVSILKVPTNWQGETSIKSGNLAAGGTLSFDLVVTGDAGGGPTTTPPPGTTSTPTPTTDPNGQIQEQGSGSNFIQQVQTLFIPPQGSSSLPSISFSLPTAITEIMVSGDQAAPRILDLFGAAFQQVINLDQSLEMTINTNIQKIFSR